MSAIKSVNEMLEDKVVGAVFRRILEPRRVRLGNLMGDMSAVGEERVEDALGQLRAAFD